MSNCPEWELPPPIAWVWCWISNQQSHWGDLDDDDDVDDDYDYDDGVDDDD